MKLTRRQLKDLIREFAPAPLIVLAPIVITTAIEIEMAIAAVTSIAAIFGITAGALLAYLNEKKEEGNTAVTLGELGDEFGEIKNRDQIARLNELEKDNKGRMKGSYLVDEIMDIIKETGGKEGIETYVDEEDLKKRDDRYDGDAHMINVYVVKKDSIKNREFRRFVFYDIDLNKLIHARKIENIALSACDEWDKLFRQFYYLIPRLCKEKDPSDFVIKLGAASYYYNKKNKRPEDVLLFDYDTEVIKYTKKYPPVLKYLVDNYFTELSLEEGDTIQVHCKAGDKPRVL
jgi:hypothetical protein